ncbi:hypothetical protein PR202_gb25282 [Eleusine coracana subsp. coracana]|uniref:Uncharacterized protein n=1 Tax=Eleusine coracana subsp. coracana TaxID=191504 RepID=A0AAV5FND6_ELECO|nr:hypothetical protein PR202_gb25282 [Eleusine coracana subsp. coracana]
MNSAREGEMSYANNSSFQRAIASVTKKARQEMVAELYRSKGRPASMTIADFGCATGPNALVMVMDAVEAVLATEENDDDDEQQQQYNINKKKTKNNKSVELHVFLNDLPGNDFNAVFQLLPTSTLAGTGCCFVSAWPGSFYGRIFPEASLDYVVSSSSLHFLSRPPPMININEISISRGRIYISAACSSSSLSPDDDVVLDAYAAQFHTDFSTFLRCRSPEIRSYLPPSLPGGRPSSDDLHHAIQTEGSFSIRTMHLFETTRRRRQQDNNKEQEQRLAIETAKTVRAVVEPMMRNHFGWAAMDALFSRYRLLLQAYYSANETRNKDDVTNVFLVLEKKQQHNMA